MFIVILSGYVPLPRRRMYWEESKDVHNKLVSQSMRRKNFHEIHNFLRATDNENFLEGQKRGQIRRAKKCGM